MVHEHQYLSIYLVIKWMENYNFFDEIQTIFYLEKIYYS